MDTFVRYYCNRRFQHLFFTLEGWLKQHRRHKTAIIWAVFLFLSFLMCLYMTGVVFALHGLPANDFIFHYQRIIAIRQSLVHLQDIGMLGYSIGYPRGLAWNVFYPWLTLAPFALLNFIVRSPVVLYVVIGIAFYFCTYVSSFYSSRTYWRSDKRAFLFVILYTNTATVLRNLIFSEDVGILLAVVFLPMALFGFIALLRKDHWLMLTIGMTMLVYSHVLATVMTTAMLLSLVIAERRRFTRRKLAKLVLSTVVTIIATSFYWVPILRLAMHNVIQYPPSETQLGFARGFSGYAGCGPAVVLPCLADLVAILASDRMNWTRLDRAMTVVVLFTMAINTHLIGGGLSDIFPWLKVFQFSYRFSMLGDLASVWILTRFLSSYPKPSYSALFGKFSALIIALVLPLSCLAVMSVHITRTKPYTRQAYERVLYHRNIESHRISGPQLESFRDRPLFTDYLPKRATQLDGAFPSKSLVYIRSRRIQVIPHAVSVRGETVSFRMRNNERNVVLPIAVYHGVHSRYRLNGHRLSPRDVSRRLTNRYQLLALKRAPNGADNLHINREEV